jgi:chromate reductase, NAD(P)H dehydrogenase (quinone)
MATTSPVFRILAVPGSLRRGSINRAMLVAAAEHARDGVEIELYDDLGSIPPFNEDDEGDRTPQPVLELRRRIDEADALLISTPEYNSSVPGVIKNAMDWASRPLGRAELVAKPTAVMSASLSAFGGVWAQAELRKALTASGARVHDQGVAMSKAAERLDAQGRLVDRELIDQIAVMVDQLVALANTPLDDEW